jgi:hypothetical protein
MLRDPKVMEFGQEEPNYWRANQGQRTAFAENGQVHLVGRQLHLSDADPFVFERLLHRLLWRARLTRTSRRRIWMLSHAFYLGYEMAKAATALTLGKQYQQDEASTGLSDAKRSATGCERAG